MAKTLLNGFIMKGFLHTLMGTLRVAEQTFRAPWLPEILLCHFMLDKYKS